MKLDVWVPHLLSEKNKMDRYIANFLLDRLKNEAFLDRIVTGDKKWVVYDNPKRKRTWREPSESGQAMAKPGLHQRRFSCSSGGIVRVHCILSYCQRVKRLMLTSTVSNLTICVAIKKKRPSLINWKGILFHHDNARPHTSNITQRKLFELGFCLILHTLLTLLLLTIMCFVLCKAV
jgi:histone-lysine N-methyltransferase SETMAR